MNCRMRLSFGFTVYCQPTQEVCHRPQMSEHAWNDEMQIELKASASIAFLSFCCYIVVHSKEALCFSKFAKPSWPPDPVLKWCEVKRFEANMLSLERMTTAGRFSKRRTCHRCKLAGGSEISPFSRSGSTCIEAKDVIRWDVWRSRGFTKNSCIAQLEQKLRQNRTLWHHDLGVSWIFGEQYTQLGQSCKACHKNLRFATNL